MRLAPLPVSAHMCGRHGDHPRRPHARASAAADWAARRSRARRAVEQVRTNQRGRGGGSRAVRRRSRTGGFTFTAPERVSGRLAGVQCALLGRLGRLRLWMMGIAGATRVVRGYGRHLLYIHML
jgi:hypothetical protein